MTDKWVYGVDASFGLLTEERANFMKLAGAKGYAQCLWTGREQPANRVANLRIALNTGLKIIGYISVSNNGHDGAWHVAQARAGIPNDIWAALVKVPVDVELTGLDFAYHIVRALDAVAALPIEQPDVLGRAHKPKDIYTSYNAWVNYMGNPTRPAGTGLWNAVWDENPDFDFPTLRFGGWQDDEVWGEQWNGGTNIDGIDVDRDQFRASALGIVDPAPPVTDVPTPPPSPTDVQWLVAASIASDLVKSFTNRQRCNPTLRVTIAFLMNAAAPAAVADGGTPTDAQWMIAAQNAATLLLLFTVRQRVTESLKNIILYLIR